MKYADLRDFLALLEQRNLLHHITKQISPKLEMTAICDRVLRQEGPALLFTNPTDHDIPVLGNLFGTQERVALGLGCQSQQQLTELGQVF